MMIVFSRRKEKNYFSEMVSDVKPPRVEGGVLQIDECDFLLRIVFDNIACEWNMDKDHKKGKRMIIQR